MPDGSVYPRRMNEQSIAAMNPHAGHDMSAAMPADHAMPAESDSHAGHGGATAPPLFPRMCTLSMLEETRPLAKINPLMC
jgi:hypothetical protein